MEDQRTSMWSSDYVSLQIKAIYLRGLERAEQDHTTHSSETPTTEQV